MVIALCYCWIRIMKEGWLTILKSRTLDFFDDVSFALFLRIKLKFFSLVHRPPPCTLRVEQLRAFPPFLTPRSR